MTVGISYEMSIIAPTNAIRQFSVAGMFCKFSNLSKTC